MDPVGAATRAPVSRIYDELNLGSLGMRDGKPPPAHAVMGNFLTHAWFLQTAFPISMSLASCLLPMLPALCFYKSQVFASALPARSRRTTRPPVSCCQATAVAKSDLAPCRSLSKPTARDRDYQHIRLCRLCNLRETRPCHARLQ